MKALIAFIVGLIAAPVLFGLAGILGRLPSDAASTPPGWENSIGGRALDASLEHRAKGLANPVSADDKTTLAAGAKLFQNGGCDDCHGSAKGPSTWGSKGLYPRAPQFFQQGAGVTAPEAYAAIHDGIRYSGMGAWSGQMTDQQIWQLANYVASIRGPGGKKDTD